MAGEIDSLMRDAHTKTEPSFAVAFRGYARRQVDDYTRTVEAQITSMLTAHGELQAQVRAMTNQLRAAHDEIGDLRRRPPTADKLAYRHLGARVEQILWEAEQEADTIRQSAIDDAERERTNLVTTLNEARAVFEEEAQRARDARDRARRELAELRVLHADEERDMHRRLEATKAELVRAETAAKRQRADAEELLTAAQDAYDRLHASAMANAETVQADLDVRMRELRARAYEEASSVALAAEVYALETVTAAEEYAAGVHGTDLTALRASASASAPASAAAAASVAGGAAADDITELTGVGAADGTTPAAGTTPADGIGARHAKNNRKSGHGDRVTNTPRSPEPSESTTAHRHVGEPTEYAAGHHSSAQGPQQNQKGTPAAPAKVASGRDPVDETPLVATAADTPGTDTPTNRVSNDDTPDLMSGAR
jgi:cell division septum initiation protein DivIVA